MEWKEKVAVVAVVPIGGPVSMMVSGTGGVVTVTAVVRIEMLPTASTAPTANLWVLAPRTVLSVYVRTLPGLASSTPSRYTLYPATATLSVEAVHLRVTDVALAMVAANPPGVEGGITSTVQVAVAGVGSMTPAAVAYTEKVWLPLISPE